MNVQIPLGEKEHFKLEFKGAEALKRPEKIAREVAAMLNSKGGDVWVGLREEAGRAVAVEAIAEPDRERRRLLDFLVDTIEPRPSQEEVNIQVIPAEKGGLLLVEVKPNSSRRPYAWIRESGRHYLLRLDDRIRPMDREEIRTSFEALGRNAGKEDLERAEQGLWGELNSALQATPEGFWLRLIPVPKLALDLDELDMSDLLLEPARTGNRRVGQNFLLAAASGGGPRRGQSCLKIGKEGVYELSIKEDGGLLFVSPLRAFHAGHEPGAEKPLWWEALFEFPVSIFRLLATMLREEALWSRAPSQDTVFLASLAFFGLNGWSLRPESPGSLDWWGYLMREPMIFESRDLVFEEPIQFSYAEVLNEPDKCGFRLVRKVYRAFGYRADQMPREFDQTVGRLVLPQ